MVFEYLITRNNGEQHTILLDDDSTAINMSICRQSAGYCFVHIKRKKVLLHRFLMGVTDRNVIVDHVDKDRDNNQMHNLRITNKQGNGWNTGRRKNNSTGVIGVVKTKHNRFTAQITGNDGRNVYIGTFCLLKEAEMAYDMTYWNLRGRFAVLNNNNNVHKNVACVT